ncbi:P-loop containing nucleoside triphosphate hydrolase protein [Dioscorea alata]|uniref:P-loop containing nucleoside triphosphate hydrolase protein n=1 Tax=Dioscorea alata TaxID=55571 RepID=A0ACB7W1Y1_DIOAL|nr:P-loop containing nucleoside triphosphate hydrolase protein [Dioscorea alata]
MDKPQFIKGKESTNSNRLTTDKLVYQLFFGEKVVNHLIVVFTGGDELYENNQNLDDYLGHECPQPLQEILISCGNRVVLFDNKTKSEIKQKEQLQKLLSVLDNVIKFNEGKAYCSDVSAYAEQKVMKKMNSEMSAESFKKKLAEEKNLRIISEKSGQVLLGEMKKARVNAEKKAQVAQQKYANEIRELNSRVSIARQQAPNPMATCIIM